MKSYPTILRERITLIGVHIKETQEGTYQETVRNLAAVWADIRALPTSTLVETEGWGKNSFPPALYRVRIRYQTLAFRRIRWRKKIYSLATPVLADPTRQWLDFTVCEKL